MKNIFFDILRKLVDAFTADTILLYSAGFAQAYHCAPPSGEMGVGIMIRVLAITAALILSAAHCPAAAPQLDSSNYPKVDGSTSTQALQCLIKSRILGKDVVVPHTDTEKSYSNLVHGRTDLILVARKPSLGKQ